VTFSSSAPVRQPAPELPDRDVTGESTRRPTPASGEELVVFLRLLWGHRRLLFRISVWALLASTLFAFLIPSRYDSTSRLMPPDSQSGSGLATAVAAISGSGAGGLGGIAGELLGLKGTSDTFVGILSSRTVQDKLIQQYDLKKIYRDRRMEDTRKDLAKHTDISVDRRSQIINITVTDTSPQRAAAISQAYVEELNRLVADLSTSSARRERIFLEGRLQAVSLRLEEAERDFSQFASKNTAIDIKEQGKAMVEAAATLQGQLIAAESEYEGLKQIYTGNNVRVRSVKARIDELQRQLQKLGGKGESATSVADLPVDSLYPSIRKLPLLGVKYADLYRRTKIQEAVLETLTKEYELARVQEAKEIPMVKVLDVANIPDKKSYPPRLLIMFLGTVSACVGAITWLVGSTMWKATDSNDSRKVFAAEVLSTISARVPMFSRNGSASQPGRGSFWSRLRGRSEDTKNNE